MEKEINTAAIEKWDTLFQADHNNRLLQNTLLQHDLKSVATDMNVVQETQMCFSDEVKSGTILAQKQSGRCWLFSALNVIRVKAMAKKHLSPDFAFSPTYLYFWDKLEKSNFLLEDVIEGGDAFLESPAGRRQMLYPAGESGQWFMFANLVKKYGLVPMEIMPETKHSSDSTEMVRMLGRIVRSAALHLARLKRQKASPEMLYDLKESYLQKIYRFLCCTLGTPKQVFSYDYKENDGTYHHIEKITPLAFASDFWGENPDDYVCVANAPGKYRPYHKTFTLEHFGNVYDGNRSLYYNIEMDVVKELLVKQLKAGESIWFGCDCMNMMDRWKGVMHDRLYLFDELFGLDPVEKGELLDCWGSSPNHNMVIAGMKTYGDGRRYWKVENSWGTEAGQNGFYIMNEGYLERYASEFIIKKCYLTKEQLAELAQEPIVLPFDDVLGA